VGANVVLNWAAIPYPTSYEVMAADAPEGPYTLAATVTAPTYSSAAASKKSSNYRQGGYRKIYLCATPLDATTTIARRDGQSCAQQTLNNPCG
jgi:hypothetical protein